MGHGVSKVKPTFKCGVCVIHYKDTTNIERLPNNIDTVMPASLKDDCFACNEEVTRDANARHVKPKHKYIEPSTAVSRRTAPALQVNNATLPDFLVLPQDAYVDKTIYCAAAPPVVNGAVLDLDGFMSLHEQQQPTQQPALDFKCAAPSTLPGLTSIDINYNELHACLTALAFCCLLLAVFSLFYGAYKAIIDKLEEMAEARKVRTVEEGIEIEIDEKDAGKDAMDG